MKGLDNQLYLIALLVSNATGLLLLFCSWKYQRLAKFFFFLLFAWAGWINWYMALHQPYAYLDYARLTFLPFYKSFIMGWFHNHIILMVGAIATCQLLIATSMWLKGWIFQLGIMGGILFSVGIVPLGVGSGFPFPVIIAIAMYLLRKKNAVDYLWVKGKEMKVPLQIHHSPQKSQTYMLN